MLRQLEIYESVTFSFPSYHQQLNVVDSNQACLTRCALNMELSVFFKLLSKFRVKPLAVSITTEF
jgi:hypothetical protein